MARRPPKTAPFGAPEKCPTCGEVHQTVAPGAHHRALIERLRTEAAAGVHLDAPPTKAQREQLGQAVQNALAAMGGRALLRLVARELEHRSVVLGEAGRSDHAADLFQASESVAMAASFVAPGA